ncbi:MAG: dihydrofolate reductase family protein [Candidatus Thermoplasmatota archaeon]|nr:dihydrofolate reductase family protein [Candidatus Thermoplasmatota archaeon]
MMPRVILHNSISLDGSLTGFEPHMELHYRLVGSYKPDAHLIGSHTITTGIELYEDGVPEEHASDFKKSKRSRSLPLWVIIDTRGALQGVLHTCRRFELCRDVILLVSERTPSGYLQYLSERNYTYHVVGRNHVDLKQALLLLSETYQIKTIVTDTGRILGNLLIEHGFVEEISLLVHPVIVGGASYPIFSEVKILQRLQLKKFERLEEHYLWLVYHVQKE